MEITVNEDQQIQIERAFNGVKFVTVNGEELSVCMRDTGYELVYEGTPIELKNGVINESQSARIRELEEALDRIVTAYNETGEVASAIRGCEQALRKTKKEQS